MAIMKKLEEVYVMKGVGSPQYYLGGDVLELDDQWKKQGIEQSFSAQTYIQGLIPKMAKLLGENIFLNDLRLWTPIIIPNWTNHH
jgi:methylmalonyl-CoA mutase cobalamin-binding subunit